jgi:HAD superfamily hydrolase (TIGR01490 family)
MLSDSADGPRRSARSAAFFDLDNTLLHGASLYFIGRGMHARGVISTGEVLRGAWQQLVFRVVGERRGDVASVRDRSLALGAGVEVAPLLALGEEIYEQFLAHRILGDTLALGRAHLERGEEVFIVTAAPVELARIVARRLGLTGALGTVSEVAEGRWTGSLVGELLHGAAKADAVRALARERGYDLARCAAYSDSMSDLPMLESVGCPHVVNPDRRLRGVATRRGWPVHDFRLRRHRRAAVIIGAAAACAGVAGYLASVPRAPVGAGSR